VSGTGPVTGGPPPWTASIRDVLVVAVLVVGFVLGAAVLTSLLPAEGQRAVLHAPLVIAVLLGVTSWILWRAARRGPPEE
jgi:heme A synthase